MASALDSALFRVGMLAALRSLQTGQACGVMITASHNGIEDNGVKIVDADGGMLARSWEKVCGCARAARQLEPERQMPALRLPGVAHPLLCSPPSLPPPYPPL